MSYIIVDCCQKIICFSGLAALLNGRNVEVSRTAMHIIASMKRDWMQVYKCWNYSYGRILFSGPYGTDSYHDDMSSTDGQKT